MAAFSLEPLTGFLRAARGRSQEDIIIEFLEATVVANPVADHGSVLINHPRQKKLILFNEGNFLFEKKLLEAGASWPQEFGYFQGIAGRSFRERKIKLYPRGQAKEPDEFLGASPIKNMVCIPILTTAGEPFGVVCFHNNDATRPFSLDEVATLESYVDILALALHTPHPELQLEKNVFIVHGHDDGPLKELQLFLHEQKVTPKVLWREDKGPKSILEEVEQLIRECKAGFILATPDDEGRLLGEQNLKPRARENVIFETGLLFAKFREFERVALLVKKPLELPSDLAGIASEQFSQIRDIEKSLLTKLKKWGLL